MAKSLSAQKQHKNNLDGKVSEKSMKKLRNTSWSVLFFSILIDTASHVRAFPSYNMILGVWACVISHYQYKHEEIRNLNEKEKIPKCKKRNEGNKEVEHLKRLISSFSILTSATIFFDIIFCCLWGDEVSKMDAVTVKNSKANRTGT